MGMIGLVASVASTALQMSAQGQEARQQAGWLNYQAQQADADANALVETSKLKAQKIRDMGDRERGSATATLAGSGVDVNSGTALEIDKNIAANAEEDAWMTVYNGVMDANKLRTQGQADRISANQIKDASRMNQTATLLGGAADAFGKSGWKFGSNNKEPSAALKGATSSLSKAGSLAKSYSGS